MTSSTRDRPAIGCWYTSIFPALSCLIPRTCSKPFWIAMVHHLRAEVRFHAPVAWAPTGRHLASSVTSVHRSTGLACGSLPSSPGWPTTRDHDVANITARETHPMVSRGSCYLMYAHTLLRVIAKTCVACHGVLGDCVAKNKGKKATGRLGWQKDASSIYPPMQCHTTKRRRGKRKKTADEVADESKRRGHNLKHLRELAADRGPAG